MNLDKNQLVNTTEMTHAQLSTLIRLGREIWQQQLAQCGAAITVRQFDILVQLGKQPLTIKQLGEVFSIEPPTLIPIIDTLERHELIKRIQDKHDRRKKNLELTVKGAQLLEQMYHQIDQNPIGIAFKSMGLTKCQQLNELLAELVQYLRAEQQKRPKDED